MKPPLSGSRFLRSVTLALPLALAGLTHAADVTWSPTPADAIWTDGGNWSTSPLAPVAGDQLFFQTSTLTALSNDFTAATAFTGVVYNAGASTFTFSGNATTLGVGAVVGNIITNNSSNTQTIGFDVTLGAGAPTGGRIITTNGHGGNVVLNGQLAGAAVSLTKAGAGSLTLTNSTNAYSGGTVISGGSIVFGSASLPSLTTTHTTLTAGATIAAGIFGTDASVVSVLGSTGNAVLQFTGAQAGTDGSTLNYVISGGVNGISNQIKVPGAGFLRSRIFFNGADYAFVDAGGYVRAPIYGVDANFNIATTTLAVGHNLVTASIADQAATNINTLKISGAGAVDLSLTGVLSLGTGPGASAGGIIRSGGGSTTISGGTVRMGTPGDVGGTPGTNYYIRTDTSADTLNISSPLAANGVNNLEKSGAGVLVLGGANLYTGYTTVLGGTLLVNGSHGTGTNYLVSEGATLGGTGFLTPTGVSSVQINGNLAPGDSTLAEALQTGILNVGNTITLNGTASLQIQIGGVIAGTGYDQVSMNNGVGAINLMNSPSLVLSLVNGFVPSPGDQFFILTRADFGTYATFFSGMPEGASFLLGGQTAYITYQANSNTSMLTGGNSVAVYLPVPEPGPLALVALGMAATIFRLRRRNAR